MHVYFYGLGNFGNFGKYCPQVNSHQTHIKPTYSPVHASPEEFGNGDFTLKMDQSVHTTPEEFKNATITAVILDFCFSVREII